MKKNTSAQSLTRFSKLIDKRLAELSLAGRRGLARRTNSESERVFVKYARAVESLAGICEPGSVRPREIAAGAREVGVSPRTLEDLAAFALEVVRASGRLHDRRRAELAVSTFERGYGEPSQDDLRRWAADAGSVYVGDREAKDAKGHGSEKRGARSKFARPEDEPEPVLRSETPAARKARIKGMKVPADRAAVIRKAMGYEKESDGIASGGPASGAQRSKALSSEDSSALPKDEHRGAPYEKKDVDYKYAPDPNRACGECRHFIRAESACEIVMGLIRATDVCSKWEPRGGTDR